MQIAPDFSRNAPLVNPVFHILDRLRDTSLHRASPETVIQDINPDHDLGLAVGRAGIVALYVQAHIQYPDQDFDQVAHEHLKHIIGHLNSSSTAAYLSIGMARGLIGVSFALQMASFNGTRYQKAQHNLDELLLPILEQAIDEIQQDTSPLRVHRYDALEGIAGIAALLASRTDKSGFIILKKIIDELTERIAAGIDQVGGFHIGHLEQPSARHALMHPQGSTDIGLAHGVSGVLAALSIAASAGFEHPSLDRSIRELASWIIGQAQPTLWGPVWPQYVTPTVDESGAARFAWCYGTPGIAAALRLAANATGETTYFDWGVRGLQAVAHAPLEEVGINSATFCHGAAGLLQIVKRFQHESLSELEQRLRILISHYHEPLTPYGISDLEADEDGQMMFVPQPGILNGAAGVALALMDTPTQGVTWDRAFLIS